MSVAQQPNLKFVNPYKVAALKSVTARVSVTYLKTKAVTDKPGVVKYLLLLCAVTFSKMRTISSEGILHIFGLGLGRKFSECHHPGSILEHTVVSIYHSGAFRFRALLTTLT